jgi:hypothetical protein
MSVGREGLPARCGAVKLVILGRWNIGALSSARCAPFPLPTSRVELDPLIAKARKGVKPNGV